MNKSLENFAYNVAPDLAAISKTIKKPKFFQIFDKFAFSTATISDWASAAETATGGRPEAGALIHQWYRPSSTISRPVLRAVVSSNSVEFNQLTEETWTVPLEISGSAGTQLAVISEKKQAIPFVSSDYVVVDAGRKSHAFVVYDVSYGALQRYIF